MAIWANVADLKDRLLGWFVDREFFMRANGQVRFLKVSAKLQRRVAGGIAALVGVWLAITLGMAINQFSSSFERLALVRKEAKVQSAAERVANYRESIGEVTKQLNQRQDVLDSLSKQYLNMVHQSLANRTFSLRAHVSNASSPSGKELHSFAPNSRGNSGVFAIVLP